MSIKKILIIPIILLTLSLFFDIGKIVINDPYLVDIDRVNNNVGIGNVIEEDVEKDIDQNEKLWDNMTKEERRNEIVLLKEAKKIQVAIPLSPQEIIERDAKRLETISLKESTKIQEPTPLTKEEIIEKEIERQRLIDLKMNR